MNDEEIIKAIEIFSINISLGDEAIKEALISYFDKDGKKIFYLMPIAFGWEIFSRLGATEFSKTIRTEDQEAPLIDVRKNQLFISLIRFADAEMTSCFQRVSKEAFESVLYFGAEGKMARQVFSDGKNLVGSKIQEPYIKDTLES